VVRLWDVKTGAPKGTLNGQVGKITAVAFGKAGKRIAVGGDTLRIRHPDGSLAVLRGHRGPILCVAFSPDGLHLLSGGSDGTVRLWRAEDGEEVRCLEGHAGGVHAVVFHPGSAAVFTGGADGIIRRWAHAV
jgi:WD40 repeat protein